MMLIVVYFSPSVKLCSVVRDGVSPQYDTSTVMVHKIKEI